MVNNCAIVNSDALWLTGNKRRCKHIMLELKFIQWNCTTSYCNQMKLKIEALYQMLMSFKDIILRWTFLIVLQPLQYIIYVKHVSSEIDLQLDFKNPLHTCEYLNMSLAIASRLVMSGMLRT